MSQGRILRTVRQLSELEGINAALYERARCSAVVGEYLADFQERSKSSLVKLLRSLGHREEAVYEAAELMLLVIDGMFLRRTPPSARTRLIRGALRATACL